MHFMNSIGMLLFLVVSIGLSNYYADGVVYYKCYKGDMQPSGSRSRPSKSSNCYGEFCTRVEHMESRVTRFSCINTTEAEQLAQVEVAGNVEDLRTDCVIGAVSGMPGQKENECFCRGDYCNGSKRSAMASVDAFTLTTGFTMFLFMLGAFGIII